MTKHGVQKFILSSTAAVYGYPEYLPIDEQHPVEPVNYYGYTKLVIEQNLKWFSELKGLRYACLRYFNAAGAHPDGDLGEDHDPETHLIPIVLQVALGQRDPGRQRDGGRRILSRPAREGHQRPPAHRRKPNAAALQG